MLIAEFYILGSVAKIVGIVVVSCFTGKVGKAGERLSRYREPPDALRIS